MAFKSVIKILSGTKPKENCGNFFAQIRKSVQIPFKLQKPPPRILPVSRGAGGNCIKIGLPGKSILRDHYQENMTSR